MKRISLIIICIVFIGCDRGLEPSKPKLGFAGTIYAMSSWPQQDSIIRLLLFASQIYPLDSTSVYNGLMKLPQRIFLYPSINESLPLGFDSISYSFPLEAGIYNYVGVVQQIDTDFVNKGIRVFRVVGFYKNPENDTLPGTVIVNEYEQIKGINIYIDFYNLVKQPF